MLMAVFLQQVVRERVGVEVDGELGRGDDPQSVLAVLHRLTCPGQRILAVTDPCLLW